MNTSAMEGTLATLALVRRARLDNAQAELMQRTASLDAQREALQVAEATRNRHLLAARGLQVAGAVLTLDGLQRQQVYGHALAVGVHAESQAVRICEGDEQEAIKTVRRHDADREAIDRLAQKSRTERTEAQQRQEANALDEHWLMLKGKHHAR